MLRSGDARNTYSSSAVSVTGKAALVALGQNVGARLLDQAERV